MVVKLCSDGYVSERPALKNPASKTQGRFCRLAAINHRFFYKEKTGRLGNTMKTKEELNALKKEVKTVSRKLHELTEEELKYIAGGDSEQISFMHIKRFIETGNDVGARYYYKSYAR